MADYYVFIEESCFLPLRGIFVNIFWQAPLLAQTTDEVITIEELMKGLSPEAQTRLRGMIANAIPDPKDAIRFSGQLTVERVTAFISKHQNTTAKTLIIRSGGGDAVASISLANWVLDKQLDVQVDIFCMSGCANYVLAAGKQKRIEPGGAVIWHGGLKQKNFRDGNHKFRLFERATKALGTAILSPTAKLQFDSDKVFWDEYVRVRTLEETFVKRAGINEYIFRMGQEPVNLTDDCWTVDKKIMALMGYKDVVADDDFGSMKSLMKNIMVILNCPGNPVAFKLNKAGDFVLDSAD